MDKMTKKDYFLQLINVVKECGNLKEEEIQSYTDFLQARVDEIDRKSSRAKERAAKEKAKGDELRERVFSVIEEKLQTVDEITEQVIDLMGEDAEVTKSKVVARLSQLFKAGRIEKDYVKSGSRKIVAYKITYVDMGADMDAD